jgi:hypothetical protein
LEILSTTREAESFSESESVGAVEYAKESACGNAFCEKRIMQSVIKNFRTQSI